ncbi:MAG: hypothetical protein ABH811_00595 [archaeon]
MKRVKFRKGRQRKFLKRVLFELNCPSLRAFIQFGFDFPYSTLKNYYSEKRLLPYEFFKNLCYIAKIDEKNLNFEILNKNWGQIRGGQISKRNGPAQN